MSRRCRRHPSRIPLGRCRHYRNKHIQRQRHFARRIWPKPFCCRNQRSGCLHCTPLRRRCRTNLLGCGKHRAHRQNAIHARRKRRPKRSCQFRHAQKCVCRSNRSAHTRRSRHFANRNRFRHAERKSGRACSVRRDAESKNEIAHHPISHARHCRSLVVGTIARCIRRKHGTRQPDCIRIELRQRNQRLDALRQAIIFTNRFRHCRLSQCRLAGRDRPLRRNARRDCRVFQRIDGRRHRQHRRRVLRNDAGAYSRHRRNREIA